MTRPPAAQSGFQIPSLDGIRALAFLLVFLGHVGAPGIPGGFGVTIFFFLSGYLITTLLRLEVEQTGQVDFKRFYLRRVLRIFPPFYLVLASAIALTTSGVVRGELETASICSQLFHYFNFWAIHHGFAGIPDGTGVYWSLAIEEHFYAVFPALYSLLVRGNLSGKQQRLVFFAICVGILLWRCALVFLFHSDPNRTYLGTDTRCDCLLLGCALAVAGNPMFDVEKATQRPSMALVLSLGVSTVLLLLSFVIRDDRFRESIRYSMQIAALYGIFFTAIRYPNWGPFPLLNTRAARFIGKLSYSLYLVHQIVLGVVWHQLALVGVPGALLVFAISLGVAWVIWLTIEKPCAKLRKRMEVAH